ncbi:response regulator [Spirosoma endophyticum]|uniref:CheY chemotaxis protein or a CheY-like REC (Receiver) domain n=1 Tax=Spirosoma endophyticum TaxID=662367 RepID=A0A1I2IEZ8_9BACT|nr:response regulator [Spirosoma endophyticum]SFF39657.1 CheY chemotaxis protein or a CheY-like REC (receiver) domain [Spirosoma endophyticum]
MYNVIMKRIETSVQANLRNAKVLIIEDNEDQWLLMSQAMQQCLPEVTPVRMATPQQAMRLLEVWCYQEWEIPKLILLDLYLPSSEEGWQLLKWIKAMPASINLIPIVMFSGSADPVDIEQSYRAGTAAYVVKPTQFAAWLPLFQELRSFWWETVTLPPLSLGL